MFENELTHAWYLATRRLMIFFLKRYLSRDAKILDAGCGTGGTIKYLQKSRFKNITGIDVSKEAIKFCRQRGIINVGLGSINKLRFKNQSFDAVICLDVLCEKGVSPEKALSEFKRVLKPKGVIYLQEPSYDWLKSKHDKVVYVRHRSTRKEIEKLMELSQFKVVRCSYFNSLLFIPLAVKRLKDKMLDLNTDRSDVCSLPKFINSFMLLILNFEAKIIQKFNLPFGLSIICLAKK
jgi:SAM-dependent methyltransferase